MGIRGVTSCITCTTSVNKCKIKSFTSRGLFLPAFVHHLQPHQWKRSRRTRPLRRHRPSTGVLLGSNKYGAANHCPSSRLGSSYISNTPGCLSATLLHGTHRWLSNELQGVHLHKPINFSSLGEPFGLKGQSQHQERPFTGKHLAWTQKWVYPRTPQLWDTSAVHLWDASEQTCFCSSFVSNHPASRGGFSRNHNVTDWKHGVSNNI